MNVQEIIDKFYLYGSNRGVRELKEGSVVRKYGSETLFNMSAISEHIYSLVLHYLTILRLRKLVNFCLEFKKGLTQEKLLIQNFQGCIYNLNNFRNAHQKSS